MLDVVEGAKYRSVCDERDRLSAECSRLRKEMKLMSRHLNLGVMAFLDCLCSCDNCEAALDHFVDAKDVAAASPLAGEEEPSNDQ